MDLLLLVLGYVAMVFSSAANIPQVLHVLRSRDSINGVSSLTHVIFMVSCGLWMAYSGLSSQWPLFINCAIVFVCNLVIFLRVYLV